MNIEEIRLTDIEYKKAVHYIPTSGHDLRKVANAATDKAIKRIISEVESIDKRHTANFVLQFLKKLVKGE